MLLRNPLQGTLDKPPGPACARRCPPATTSPSTWPPRWTRSCTTPSRSGTMRTPRRAPPAWLAHPPCGDYLHATNSPHAAFCMAHASQMQSNAGQIGRRGLHACMLLLSLALGCHAQRPACPLVAKRLQGFRKGGRSVPDNQLCICAAQAEGSNQTLPAAPSGQQPPPAQTGSSTFLGIRVDWSNPVFVVVSIQPLNSLPQIRCACKSCFCLCPVSLPLIVKSTHCW